MSREWKRGDVAIWPRAAMDDDDLVVFRYFDLATGTDEWMSTEEGGAYPLPSEVRPLVVIDPEDAEQTKRLRDLIVSKVSLQTALREFASPAPPKPAEPTGLGAVVQENVRRWVRSRERTTIRHWHPADGVGDPRTWDELANPITVLSEGVPS